VTSPGSGGPAGLDGVVRVGVAVGIPQPWGAELDHARAAAGDPMAPFIPSHVTLLGPTDVSATALPAIEDHLSTVAGRYAPFDVQIVTAEPAKVTAAMTAGHGAGIGDVRSAISRTPVYNTTCAWVASVAPLNAASR